jgi:hypothetical protein
MAFKSMRNASTYMKYGCAVLIGCSMLAYDTGAQRAAPEKFAPKDTVFEEIVLTEEGVFAIDTSGYEWYYDFEYSVFVAGIPAVTGEGLGIFDDPRYEYSGIPIEERATIRKKVKHFEIGPVTVRDDEYVEGDIKALNMVTVKGWVQGDVISINDRVLISETGQVDGDVEAPQVILKDGGVVLGSVTESQVPLRLEDFTAGFSHEFLLVMSIITASFLFAGFILLALMPRQLTNIEDCIINHRGRSFFLGFLTFLVMPALVILLAITIVGVVLIPLVPFIYAGAILLGIVATGRGAVSVLLKKFFSKQPSPIFMGLIGILLLMLPWLLAGALMGTEGGPSYGFGVFFLVLAIIIMIFPVFSGVGAAFLTRFGFRTYSATVHYGPRHRTQPPTPPVVPAPPPIPDVPFSQKEET